MEKTVVGCTTGTEKELLVQHCGDLSSVLSCGALGSALCAHNTLGSIYKVGCWWDEVHQQRQSVCAEGGGNEAGWCVNLNAPVEADHWQLMRISWKDAAETPCRLHPPKPNSRCSTAQGISATPFIDSFKRWMHKLWCLFEYSVDLPDYKHLQHQQTCSALVS